MKRASPEARGRDQVGKRGGEGEREGGRDGGREGRRERKRGRVGERGRERQRGRLCIYIYMRIYALADQATDVCGPNVLEEVAESDDCRDRKRDKVYERSKSVSSEWRDGYVGHE